MFTDKNETINGVTDGIGLGIAHAFAHQKAHIILIIKD